MKILLYWFDSNGLDHQVFECKGDVDFKLWQLVKDGSIVTICKVDDEE